VAFPKRPSVHFSLGKDHVDVDVGADLRGLRIDQSDNILWSTFPLQVWIDYTLEIAARIGCKDYAVPGIMDHLGES
jgi:hypothetical protein